MILAIICQQVQAASSQSRVNDLIINYLRIYVLCLDVKRGIPWHIVCVITELPVLVCDLVYCSRSRKRFTVLIVTFVVIASVRLFKIFHSKAEEMSGFSAGVCIVSKIGAPLKTSPPPTFEWSCCKGCFFLSTIHPPIYAVVHAVM